MRNEIKLAQQEFSQNDTEEDIINAMARVWADRNAGAVVHHAGPNLHYFATFGIYDKIQDGVHYSMNHKTRKWVKIFQ